MQGLGLGTVFRSEKIPRNRLGTVSVIPQKKALIPRHSEIRGIANSEVRNGTERNGIPRKKLVLRNSSKKLNKMIYLYIKSRLFWHHTWHSESIFLFFLHEKEFRIVFSSAECFGTEFRESASILVPRNGIPSYFLFRRRVRNRIMGVYLYFWSTERYSELCSLPRKGSEWNSEIFCSAE